jgi:hypothetical protein
MIAGLGLTVKQTRNEQITLCYRSRGARGVAFGGTITQRNCTRFGKDTFYFTRFNGGDGFLNPPFR